MVQQPLVGQGLLIFFEDSLSHPVRHCTLGTTPLDEYQPDAETSA